MVKGKELHPEVNESLWDVDIDFSMDYYLVRAANGVVVREGAELESPIVGLLYENTPVVAKQRIGNRILICRPVSGFVSLKNKQGYNLLELILPAQRQFIQQESSQDQLEKISDDVAAYPMPNQRNEAVKKKNKKRYPGYDRYRIINRQGCYVRKEISLESQKIGLLYQNTVAIVRAKVGSRLQVIEPMQGWISLKNQSGYVLLESLSNITSHELFSKELKPTGLILREEREEEKEERN